jgi:hypothetical protein
MLGTIQVRSRNQQLKINEKLLILETKSFLLGYVIFNSLDYFVIAFEIVVNFNRL